MMKSIETQPVLINLALAVADALEDPTTPASLMDALRELATSLVDELSGEKLAPQLRALALASSGHSSHMTACSETESTPTVNPALNSKHQAQEAEPLANASASQGGQAS